ncbi:phage tail protein [Diaphorobacter sp. HDW4B]|uniref:phage tail protein n=1 Tax=Diaphorobacter sp. HDW4B TaxID=2714925 RepID=UPI00140C7168|nr:tail fiber protein [Diaphorobacter sp. HDW4B]QIL72982.1 phage tail protein [Diaphorobacter sp. HDW4B]
MADPFVGEIRMFGFNYAPPGWAFCNGQILGIQQNSALFALLGTTYGGNGSTSFGLPNLQGRFPTGIGQAVSGRSYTWGQQGGSEAVTLNTTQIPAHAHATVATTNGGTQQAPDGTSVIAASNQRDSQFAQASGGGLVAMSAQSGALTGGNQAHENMPPYLALNFSIALVGIFPSRN